MGTIGDQVRSGNKVTIYGFGSFNPTSRKARTGRNPRTGQPVKIAASKGIRFSPATGFKADLNAKKAAKKAAPAKAPAAKAPAAKAVRAAVAAKAVPAKATNAVPGKAPARKAPAKAAVPARAARPGPRPRKRLRRR